MSIVFEVSPVWNDIVKVLRVMRRVSQVKVKRLESFPKVRLLIIFGGEEDCTGSGAK